MEKLLKGVIVFLAVVSVILAGVFAVQKLSSVKPADQQEATLDPDEYNSDEIVSTADGEKIYLDSSDDTLEMDSIPSDVESAGTPAQTSDDSE